MIILIHDSLTLLTDLSHLFDWNTKELFVMLVAHYHTPKNVRDII